MLATAIEKKQYGAHALNIELCNIASKDTNHQSKIDTYCRYSQGKLIEKEEKTPFGTTWYSYIYAKNGSICQVQHNGVTVERYYYGAVGKYKPVVLCDELVSFGGKRRSFWYDKQNRLQECDIIQCTWKYDRLIRIKHEEYSVQLDYTENGMPSSVLFSDGKEIRYIYGNGKLVARCENGVLSDKYVWDKHRLHCHYSVKNAMSHHFYYDSAKDIRPRSVRIDTYPPYAMHLNNSMECRLLWDTIGSLRGLYNSILGIVGYCEYDTYGNVVCEHGYIRQLPFSYSGALYDTETGIHFSDGSFSIPSLYITCTVRP